MSMIKEHLLTEEELAYQERDESQAEELRNQGRKETSRYILFLYNTFKNAGYPSLTILEFIRQNCFRELDRK